MWKQKSIAFKIPSDHVEKRKQEATLNINRMLNYVALTLEGSKGETRVRNPQNFKENTFSLSPFLPSMSV